MADVEVVIGVDNKAAVTGLKQVGTEVKDVGDKATKSGSALGDMAKIAGGFVLAQGLMKLPGLLSGFIGGASDLNESLSKVNTVFGQNAKEIENWASSAAKNLGMSKGAALEAAGTFGNFLQAMGATLPVATDMSKSMVQLATDLGSFNNASPEEVLLALRSGLSGEAEPLKKFGVALSQAAVEAKGMELGLGKLGKEMTEQEKITARYAIIMDQTKTAQGDFERTSGGLANQTKILKAMFKDAGDTLGTALLPGIVAIMGAIIQLVPYAVALGEAIGGKLAEGFRAVKDAVGGFIGDVQWLVENGGSLMDIVAGDNEPTFWQKLAFFVAQALPVLKDIAGLAWDGIKAGVEALGKLGAIAWDGVKDGANALKDLAQAKFDQVAPQLERIRDAVRDVKLKDFADGWDVIKQKVQPAIDTLAPLADRLLKALKEQLDAIKSTLGPLGKSFEDLGEALKPLAPVVGVVLVVAIGALILALEGLVKLLGSTVTVAIQGITLLIQGIAKAIEGVTYVVQEWGPKIGSAFGTIAKVFEANLEIIVGLFKPLMNIGEGVIKGIVAGIEAGKEALLGAAKAMVGWIEGAIPDWIPHSPSKAGVLIGQGVVFGIAKGIEDTASELDAPLMGIAVKFEGVRDKVIEYARDIAISWKAELGSLYDNVPDYVKKFSPAAGGNKSAAGPYNPVTPWYVGGGQTAFGPSNPSAVPIGSYYPGIGYKTANGWEQTQGAAASIDAAYASGAYGNAASMGKGTTINLVVDGAVLARVVTDQLARAM